MTLTKAEKQVMVEKEGLLTIAVLLLSTGATLCLQGKELVGLALCLIGVGIVFLRGHFKLNRWLHVLGKNRGD